MEIVIIYLIGSAVSAFLVSKLIIQNDRGFYLIDYIAIVVGCIISWVGVLIIATVSLLTLVSCHNK